MRWNTLLQRSPFPVADIRIHLHGVQITFLKHSWINFGQQQLQMMILQRMRTANTMGAATSSPIKNAGIWNNRTSWIHIEEAHVQSTTHLKLVNRRSARQESREVWLRSDVGARVVHRELKDCSRYHSPLEQLQQLPHPHAYQLGVLWLLLHLRVAWSSSTPTWCNGWWTSFYPSGLYHFMKWLVVEIGGLDVEIWQCCSGIVQPLQDLEGRQHPLSILRWQWQSKLDADDHPIALLSYSNLVTLSPCLFLRLRLMSRMPSPQCSACTKMMCQL